MSARRTLEPEDQIARYRVVGPLATGGMGEVYLARDETLDRRVALKVLPPRLVRSEERVRRFITEAKSASSLNHPNIVTIYEIGHDRVRSSTPGEGDAATGAASDPVHFISMELVEGDTLGRKIHEENTDLRTLLGWLAQAAEGIAKAHAAGIVHRDLKPGNIMVSNDGYAKVLDFGLAKLTERQSETTGDATSAPTEAPATGEGTVLGTSGYMSPEQVQGKSVDARSDIFSLGCVLYEAATRRRPFAAETDIEVMHRILRDRPTPVEEIAPQVPSEVRRIIRRCLAKSPDQRFQSMKDLAIELREVFDEYDSLQASGGSTLGGAALSGIGSVSGGASAIGSVAGPGSGGSAPGSGGGSLASGSSPASGALPVSVPSGSMAAARPARRGLLLGIVAALVLAALAAGAYAFRGRLAAGGGGGARGKAAPEMKMSVLMSREDLSEAVLSSDGRYLAYVTTGEEKTALFVRQVRTGSDVRILPPQEYAIRGVSFSPDSDYLYYLNQDPETPAYSALFQVPSLGGTPRKVAFDVDTAARLSPDGARIAFRRGMPNINADTLIVAELSSGKEREVARLADPANFTTAPWWSPDGRRVAVAVQTLQGGVHSWVSVIDVESGVQEKLEGRPFQFISSLAWLPDGQSLVCTAFEARGSPSQVFRLSYPGGEARRLTSDLSGYEGVSVTSSGDSFAAIRRTDVSNVWIAPVEEGQPPRPLTTATGVAGSSWGPQPLEGGGIAFIMREGDRSVIWRAAGDGSERRALTTQGIVIWGMLYAPRSGLVFNQASEDSIGHVWRVDADGSGPRQLTSGSGERVTDLAGDGRFATLEKADVPSKIWTLDLVAGGEPKLLASETTGDTPIISPDGTRIMYTDFTRVQGRIYSRHLVVPAGGGPPLAEFVLPPGAMASNGGAIAHWSPDGKSIAYVDRNEGWNLMSRPIAGGAPVALTRFKEGRTLLFDWSPDGTRIALVRRIGQKEGLWLFQPGKGEPRLLVAFQAGLISPLRWSRDSKSVAFAYATAGKDVALISDFQ